jgi:hypothetical protein
MKRLKTYALSAAALGGLFLVGSLMRSRDSQAKGATYSTPVTVMNTQSGPVLSQDVDHPARHPYSATCTRDQQGSTLSCIPSPPPPANAEVVIQNIDMLLDTFANNSGTPMYGYLGYITGGAGRTTYVPFTVPPTGPSSSRWWPAHAVTAIYADPNSTFGCNLQAANLAPDGLFTCTVSGYYVTLP